jgi:hypothetical protein
MFSWLRVIALIISVETHALVGIGGYVPFGPSTQKDTTGSKNTFSLDPMLSVNTVIPTGFYNQLFLPEFGYVFHGEGDDGYSKKTMLFLADFGHRLSSTLVLRYGLGTTLTRIGGDGGAVSLRNGGSSSTFYRAGESETSWNTTINFGIETAINPNYAFRFQTYWFSLFDGESRKGSYSFNILYYL